MTDYIVGFPPIPAEAFQRVPDEILRWRVIDLDGDVLARFRGGKSYAWEYMAVHPNVKGAERELLYHRNGHWHAAATRGEGR